MTSDPPSRHHLQVDPGALNNGDVGARPPATEFSSGAPLIEVPDSQRRQPRQTRWHQTWPRDPAASDNQLDVDDATPKTKSKWRKPVSIIGLIVMVAVIAIVLNGKLPKPSEIWHALGSANWAWVLLGAAAMLLSVFSFAEQQRLLLEAFEARISRRRITTITFGGTALTNSLPAGAAVSAGFSFTQYRQSGANRSTAATVMVLSGLLSVGSLALLYFMVLGAATGTAFVTMVKRNPVVAILVALLVVGVLLLVVKRSITGTPREISDKPTPKLDRWELRWPRLGSFARDGLETVRQARLLKVRYLTLAIAWSVLKWATEAVCLLVSCWAFDISVNLVQLAVIYLGVQLIRQVPFTPGGIGLVEASLLAGLVSAGAPTGAAAAAVLIYRLLSAWLIIPVGFALLAEMKRREAKGPAALESTADA